MYSRLKKKEKRKKEKKGKEKEERKEKKEKERKPCFPFALFFNFPFLIIHKRQSFASELKSNNNSVIFC